VVTGPEPDAGSSTPAEARAVAQVFVTDLETLPVEADDVRHLRQVLRLRAGEAVVAADGAGAWRLCRFAGTTQRGTPRERVLVPDGPVTTCARPAPEVTVAFVPVKGDRPEWAVQKLTEAGVDRIVLLRSARAVVRWEAERAATAVDRLRRVAREAAAQSRRPWLPEVSGVVSLDDLARRLAPVPLALADPAGAPPSLELPALAVGPEGGWDASETAAAYPLVGLGPTVLRAETASVAAGLLLCALRTGVVRPAAPAGGPPPPGAGG